VACGDIANSHLANDWQEVVVDTGGMLRLRGRGLGEELNESVRGVQSAAR